MMELNVTLEFACCCCDDAIKATVQCSGKGLMQEAKSSLATINVPCPTCGQVNKLQFEPSGRVRSVLPYTCFRVVPEPSVN